MFDSPDVIVTASREEMPEVSGLVLQIARRTARLHELLEAALGAELAKLGLNRAEFEVLAELRRTAAPFRAKPGALVTPVVTAAGGIQKVGDRMLAAGLLRRLDPADGCSPSLELTEKGVRFAETAARNVSGVQEALLLRAPKERVRELSEALRLVLAALGDAPSESRPPRPQTLRRAAG